MTAASTPGESPSGVLTLRLRQRFLDRPNNRNVAEQHLGTVVNGLLL